MDEATSALDSGNEAALYARLRESGATLISIAHRPAVLRYHTHVLQLMGEGAWALYDARDYQFDAPALQPGSREPAPSSLHQSQLQVLQG
jgi:putative ATP-binding cassette transporter